MFQTNRNILQPISAATRGVSSSYYNDTVLTRGVHRFTLDMFLSICHFKHATLFFVQVTLGIFPQPDKYVRTACRNLSLDATVAFV